MTQTQKKKKGDGDLPAKLIQDLTLAETLNDAKTAAQLLIDSETLPTQINSVEKVFVITKYGRELGLDEMTALNSLHIIKGKITMSYQLIGSLLKRHNYEWNVIKDFEPILKDGEQTGNFETIIEFTWIPQKFISLAERFDRKDLIKVFTHVERRTWNEFSKAGYIKNQWITLPKLMMRIRTFTFGARFIAPEALQNVYETSEIADMGDVNYIVDAEGNVVYDENSENTITPEVVLTDK